MIREEYDNGHQVARNRWKETVFCGEICGVGCWEGVWRTRSLGGRSFFFFLVNYIYGKSKTIEIVVLYLKENMSRFVNVNVNFRLGDSSWRGFLFR